MTVPTAPQTPLILRAEIAWLGPIMGAASADQVTIAGAEDPALGKAFCAALVPVIEDGTGHYKIIEKAERELKPAHSDRHGWFRVVVPTDLWEHDAAGVLLVLLYNQSHELLDYTYDDLSVDQRPKLRSVPEPSQAPPRKTLRRPPVTDELAARIQAAVDQAIPLLLEHETAQDLRKGLAEILDRPSSPPRDELVLAVASCQYPSSIFEDEVAGASYTRLGEHLLGPADGRPQCLLLVGDQIYVDGTAGLFDPTSQFDRYVRPYEILYRMPAVRNVLRRLPAFMMLDDHEIVNNWEPRLDDTRPDPVMVEGRSSYIKFQRRHGPELQPPVADSRHPLWYPFRVNGYALFMTDTRTERTWRTAGGIPTSKIMSNGQCEALLAWLDQQRDDDRPKVIASPAILLPRHARAIQRGSVASALRSDSWDGYPLTLYTLLAHIASHEIRNVVFVSGDEHISCVARAELETKGHPPVVVHSVHSSPLYAPFPFANSERADLVASDDFTFASEESERVSCHVQAEFGPPGDGYSVLRFTRAQGGWTMQCRFDRAAGGSATIVRKLY